MYLVAGMDLTMPGMGKILDLTTYQKIFKNWTLRKRAKGPKGQKSQLL
ncbi:MAG: hypothetical protein Ct9H300mP18_09660 [Candidatus Neomarinimicrobiota bacterium]|nr:MAG: hypothetical protein Ct9H300mP18_09660 [Candidatus Neomarinimicrobiota bacterium]